MITIPFEEDAWIFIDYLEIVFDDLVIEMNYSIENVIDYPNDHDRIDYFLIDYTKKRKIIKQLIHFFPYRLLRLDEYPFPFRLGLRLFELDLELIRGEFSCEDFLFFGMKEENKVKAYF